MPLTLDCGKTYTTGRSVNKDEVALLDAGPNNKGSIARWCRHKEAGSIHKRPAFGSWEEGRLLGLDFGSVRTLASSKHT